MPKLFERAQDLYGDCSRKLTKARQSIGGDVCSGGLGLLTNPS